MTLGDMINRIMRILPQATGGTISQASIIAELNHGCNEVNLLAKCYETTLRYSLPASTAPTEFSLSTMFPGYLGIDKSGIWFFDTSGVSHYIYPRTKRWLDINIRNWRDNSGGTIPTWYYIRNDVFGLYPYVNVSGTSISADCIVTASAMTNATNYPWTNAAIENTALRPFDNAIIAYALWKLAPAVMDKESRSIYQQEFIAEVKKASAQVKNRQDMTSDSDYYIRTDIEGSAGFLPR